MKCAHPPPTAPRGPAPLPPVRLQALSEGLITQADVNVSLARLFRVFLKTGWFDALGSSALQGIGLEEVCSPAALELMRDSAVQGIVLVKNNNSALPLRAASTLRSALVVGPNFRADLWSYYGWNVEHRREQILAGRN